MQQIERYSVIVLVFFLVTIVAISFWGDSKSPGFWARLTGKGDAKKEQVLAAQPTPPTTADQVAQAPLPLDPAPANQSFIDLPPTGVGGAAGLPGSTDAPSSGVGSQPLANGTQPGTLDATAQPPTVPAPSSQPAPYVMPAPSKNVHVVKKGESLASIAAKTLGAEGRWREIQALNNNIKPSDLRPGMSLVLPGPATAKMASDVKPVDRAPVLEPKIKAQAPVVAAKDKPTAPSVKTSRTVKVQSGDTLRKIAARELGDAARWQDIAQANPSVKPNALKVGQVLQLPGAKSTVVAAGPAAASVRRPVAASSSATTTAVQKPRVR